MSLIKTIEQVDINNVIISNKIENTVLQNSLFYKLYYSNNIISMNGIYIDVNLYNYNIEKQENKKKLSFNNNDNNTFINKLIAMEKQILNILSIKKNKTFSLMIQLEKGFIKLYNEVFDYTNKYSDIISGKKKKIILKISGLWEDEKSYGLTFKFIQM